MDNINKLKNFYTFSWIFQGKLSNTKGYEAAYKATKEAIGMPEIVTTRLLPSC